jgi:hypothetical protein
VHEGNLPSHHTLSKGFGKAAHSIERAPISQRKSTAKIRHRHLPSMA